MRKLLESTADRAIRYLEGINDRNVAPGEDAIDGIARFDESLPNDTTESKLILKMLDEIGSPASMAMAGPRFLAANWLVTAWDQNSALYQVTPATSLIEGIALRWLLDLLKLPPESGGAFVTGATVANFTALAAARHMVLEQVGWNVEAEGLFGAPPVTVIVGEEAHPTLFKSLGLLGFGRSRVVKVPADAQGRMKSESIPTISGPTIVCTQAGNVNTGAFDPIGTICDIAREAGAWVHVDGAFGLWAVTVPSRAYLTEGIEKADSWAADAHKWLNVPYDSGFAIVRDINSLQSAMAITAEYLPTSSPYRNPSDYTPELSRRARGVEIWAALRHLGRKGVTELIERCCQHAKRFAEALDKAGYQILNEVVLNQVLVSFGNPDTTNRIIAAIQTEGTCWCGGTTWQGHTAMRISVSSWATTDEDVDRSIEAILRVAQS